MNKKRTKAIRNFLALLVLLTTGGTQQVWADEDLDDINDRLTITPDGSGCTAEAISYQTGPDGHCYLLKVVLKVKPAAGYYTKLDFITATDGDEDEDGEETEFVKFIGDVSSVDEADTDPDKNYSSERTITIYWGDDESCNPTTDNIHIFVKFEPVGLKLLNGMQPKATVTFYEPNSGFDPEDPTFEFDPTDYLGDDTGEHLAKMPATVIDNTDGVDRWVIAHIEPADGYWTDESILFAMEAGALQARAKTIGFDQGQQLKLLKADEYNAAYRGDDPKMKPRQDGAGWYYYKLLGSHKYSFEDTGYKYSIINGFMVKQFDLRYDGLNDKTNVSQNDNIVTVTNDEGWTAILTLDAVSFVFDGTGTEFVPSIESLVVKKDETEMFNLTPNQIAQQLEELSGNKTIYDKHSPYLRANNYSWLTERYYSWFKNNDGIVRYAITVPFDGSGTDKDPWQIKSANDLDLLAKCVNIGEYFFYDEYLKQINEIDMGDIDDFLPIGATWDYPFLGTFDGNNKPISNLTIAIDISESATVENILYSDVWFVPVGLFGFVGEGKVENVILRNSTISFNSDMHTGAVGGIAGMSSAIIKNCTVDGCTISGKIIIPEDIEDIEDTEDDAPLTVGGIVGGTTHFQLLSARQRRAPEIDESNPNLFNNRVKGNTTITSEINNDMDCPIGAIFGSVTTEEDEEGATVLYDNKYAYNVKVVRKKGSGASATTSTAQNYDKRGTTGLVDNDVTLLDITEDEGAMMDIHPVTLSVTPIAGYSSSVQIDPNPTTTKVEKLVAGSSCYKIEKVEEGDVPYLAAEDEKTLVVSPLIERTDDGRTFHADLTSLKLNNDDLTIPTSGNTTTFTMPSENADITATYTEADWFTIDTNQKPWMSFYHEWTNGSDAATHANYTVTDYLGSKEIVAKTISAIDGKAGTFTTTDLVGICYYGVPTMFNCAGNLPEKLKFEPVTGKTAPEYDSQFKGVKEPTPLSGDKIYMMNGQSNSDGTADFIRAYITDDDNTLAAHNCYIDLKDDEANHARLRMVDEATGIGTIVVDDDTNDTWYSLDGRRMEGRPAKKGVYINGGRKVVIK